MRFRLHGGNLHVHGCPEHERGCDFFDHAPEWLFASRDAARAQLLTYRASVAMRVIALQSVLRQIDAMLLRLDSLSPVRA